MRLIDLSRRTDGVERIELIDIDRSEIIYEGFAYNVPKEFFGYEVFSQHSGAPAWNIEVRSGNEGK